MAVPSSSSQPRFHLGATRATPAHSPKHFPHLPCKQLLLGSPSSGGGLAVCVVHLWEDGSKAEILAHPGFLSWMQFRVCDLGKSWVGTFLWIWRFHNPLKLSPGQGSLLPLCRGGIFLTLLQGSSSYLHYMNKGSESQTFKQLPPSTIRYRTGNWGFCTSKFVFFPYISLQNQRSFRSSHPRCSYLWNVLSAPWV